MFFGTGLTSSVIHAAGRRRRDQGPAEHAGGAGIDKARDAGSGCFLKQVEGAADVRIDEFLPAVGDDVRLVEGRGVKDRFDATHGAAYESAIGKGTGMGGELGGKHIETSHLEGQIPQGSNQTFSQVPRASGNQDLHRPMILPQASGNPLQPSRTFRPVELPE